MLRELKLAWLKSGYVYLLVLREKIKIYFLRKLHNANKTKKRTVSVHNDFKILKSYSFLDQVQSLIQSLQICSICFKIAFR